MYLKLHFIVEFEMFLLLLCGLLRMSGGSDVFHEGSKVTFYPNSEAKFFGYTVVFAEKDLVIGAPKANLSRIASGAVFSCPTNDLERKNVSCAPKKLENSFRLSSTRDFYRDDMWFGASITALPTGKLLVCAPRWAKPYQDRHLLAYGACYLHMKRRSIPLFPLADMRNQAFMTSGSRKEYGEYGTNLYYYAYAQAGMSVKATGNSTFIIGAPGLLQWTGGIVEYVYNTDVNSLYCVKRPPTNPYYTHEIGPDDYLGYSVESGAFEDGGPILYVAGAPRAKRGLGLVLVFESAAHDTDPLKIQARLTGPQLGAYFGASLSCFDVNGDGRMDLLVGAPNYVGKGEEVFDQGAVFVYLNKESPTGFILDYSGSVRGSEAVGARFGSTMGDLGDIDGDGFRDIAIGAPWEGNGKGAVYIYRGNKNGLGSKYLQRIVASGAKSFGMSIAKGYDVDGNKCNDLAVGAHASDTAYIYRCIPTMAVHALVKIPKTVDLPQNVTNFTAEFCISVPPQSNWPHIGIDLKASITIDPEGNRAMIHGETEYQVAAKAGTSRCDEQVVEVKPTADLSKPIVIKFDLEPVETMKKNDTKFQTNAVRLSDESNLHSEVDIQLTRDCGEDLICSPWLEMSLKAIDSPHIPGSGTRLGAVISVVNREEPAFGTRVHLTLPSQPKRVPNTCNLQGLNMTCSLPSPLYRNHSVTWEVELEYTLNVTDEDELFIDAVLEDPVFSRNISEESSQELLMIIVPEAHFNVSGKALPNVTVPVSREKLAEGGVVPFVHYFEVTNAGPSDWPFLDARLHLPEKVKLATVVEGCVEDDNATVLECTWSVPARVSLPVVLPLRFDCATHGTVLEADPIRNVTTILLLYEQNKTVSITSTLVLAPARPLWPLIAGSSLAGVILLSVLTYLMHRNGFFSRKRVQDYKSLQDQASQDPGSSPEQVNMQEPNCSSDTSPDSVPHDSSLELLFESDSD